MARSLQLAEVLGAEFGELEPSYGQLKSMEIAEGSSGEPRVSFVGASELMDAKLPEGAVTLVIVESPTEYATQALFRGDLDISEQLDCWINETNILLNFFQRNRKASAVLISQSDIKARPKDCLALLNDIGIGIQAFPSFPESEMDPMLELLADLLAERHTRSGSIYQEILVASSLIRQDEETGLQSNPNVKAVSAYIQARAKVQQRLQQATASLRQRESELELAQLQVHQLQEEVEALHLASVENAQEVKDEVNSGLVETVEHELKSELELALLQIHQLQEELEIYYEKYLEVRDKRKSYELFGKSGSGLGSESLRVLRLARSI